MGDDAVIVQGAGPADEATAALQREALYSTVHGAGRVMSPHGGGGQDATVGRGRSSSRARCHRR